MGCKQSKGAADVPQDVQPSKSLESKASRMSRREAGAVAINTSSTGSRGASKEEEKSEEPDGIYKLLEQAQSISGQEERQGLYRRALKLCESSPETGSYQNPSSQSTPLHVAVRLLDTDTTASVLTVVQGLLQAFPDAALMKDADGNIPLHYAVAPSAPSERTDSLAARAKVLPILIQADVEASMEFLHRTDIPFRGDPSMENGCSALYRALQVLPDDFEMPSPTVEYITVLRDACPTMVGAGNASDGDKPLALLYRRFTRQFDLAEKFFNGDNSRSEVVEHRRRFKTAAGNTWRIIECLLRPEDPDKEWKIVHRAVQVEAPPDLLRYIVETNAEDLTRTDRDGNLPIHYAAKSKPSPHQDGKTSFPAFYTKYVVDELLYKFPEAATMTDADGQLPLTLAVDAGKQWIGGGIKSLYDANPSGLEQIDLEEHPGLKKVIAEEENGSPTKEEKVTDSVIPDEQHDAIMLVQQKDVDISEVVTSMWAHEEDAGVQMLSCVAIAKMVRVTSGSEDLLRIALSAVAAVVNAMKAHPNEVIVQEKACHALRLMAPIDGQREISFVASGAVAAIVGAMQAHVSDAGAQEEACGAIAEIIHAGGADRATIVASVSGLTALVNAIAAHPEVVGVQREACQALKELTEYPNANLPDLPRSQTAPLLEAARIRFPAECGEAVDVIMPRLS